MKSSRILFFLVLIFVCSGCKSQVSEAEIYDIPKGFKGTVIVLFNQPDGQEKEYFYSNGDSARIYRIPNDGVLKTQFEENCCIESANRLKYFYSFESEDNCEPLPAQLFSSIKFGKNIVKVYAYQKGKVFIDDNPVEYISFDVGSYYDFFDSEGNRLEKWKDYVFKTVNNLNAE